MDKELKFTPLQYKEKLINYSKDIVDFESFSGMFKYKVNKNDNPTVVEGIEDYFKIYISTKPKVTLWTTYPMNSDTRGLFYAQVYISDHDIEIKIFWRKFYKIIYPMWYLFIIGLMLIPIKENDSFIFPFVLFLFVSIYMVMAKRRFKKLIVNFLNGL